ncbi:hypothetical protein DKB58_02460 [Capnocytophaga canimorsus]|nr:hypothetical protein DKB58_02460 [Capnocytophaga canimorsus]AYW36501.1 hypothetical protein D8L92_03710 [Capnocytophaga canimorsus]
MKYYKLKMKRRFEEEDKVLGHANGEFVPNGAFYFDRIGEGEIIENAPVFDYFHLQSFGEEKDWEWRLQDVHGYMGEYPTHCIWYISDKLKTLLENFKIAPKYHFYETRLLYKGEKLKYWIFQFPIDYFLNVNYEKSFFSIPNENILLNFRNREEFLSVFRAEYRRTKKKLVTKTICFTDSYDLLANNIDILCSERLKQSIEENNIAGFEFSDLDYEVVVE